MKFKLFLALIVGMLQSDMLAQQVTMAPGTKQQIILNSTATYKVHHTALRSTIIELLDPIEASLAYYKAVENHPYRFFLSRSPLSWVNGKDRATVVKKALKKLSHIKDQLSEDLGKLDKQSVLFEQTAVLTDQEIEGLITTIHDIIQLQQRTAQPDAIATAIQNFKESYTEKIKAYEQPSHLQRNWLAYCAAVATVATAYSYYQKHPEQFAEWIQQAKAGVNNFYTNQLQEPVYELKEIFIEGNQGSLATLKIEQETLGTMAKDYHLYRNSDKYTPDQINAFYKEAKEGNLGPIMSEYAVEINKPFYSLDYVKLVRHMLMQTQQAKVEIYKLRVQNQGLLATLTLIPASVLAAGGYYTAQKLYNIVSPTKQAPTEIKTQLLNLDQILNQASNSSELSDKQQGYVCYILEKLMAIAPQVPLAERMTFVADIQELQRFDFSPQQKLNTVNRMFKRFSFL